MGKLNFYFAFSDKNLPPPPPVVPVSMIYLRVRMGGGGGRLQKTHVLLLDLGIHVKGVISLKSC